MDISIFGYKLNLEILILIGVVYLILIGHTVCGCCRFKMAEGLDNMSNSNNDHKDMNMDTQVGNGDVSPAGSLVAGKPKNGAGKVNGKADKEGFAGANTNFGQSSPYDLTSNTMVDTSSWSNPNLNVVSGKPLNPAVKQFLNRKQQQLPLPEGEMDFFANVDFKPECCPNTYSNSMGCACMTSQDYNYLITRSGNNVPYSNY
jgi:hypothetical protein